MRLAGNQEPPVAAAGSATQGRLGRGPLLFFWLSLAVFVAGGLFAGFVFLGNVRMLLEPARHAGDARGATLTGQLATRPSSGDRDTAPPPFAAASGTAPPARSPSHRLTTLLMGIDLRPNELAAGANAGRTDTLLLVSADFDAHTAVLVSIPRDGFVVIPGHGNERVNTAFTLGELTKRGTGPTLAKATIAQLFGVPVDRYALVDVHSMERIIDQLGGIWIDNPFRLIDHEYPTDNYGIMTVDIPAGRQLMNGRVAVEYARMRHPDSDFGRQTRQQQVLFALRDRVLQLEVLPRLPTLLPELLKLVRTDLSPVEIGQLANLGGSLKADRDLLRLQPDGNLTPTYTGPGGASYVNLTPGYQAAVRLLITQPRAMAEQASLAVLNAGAPEGTGGQVAQVLTGAGLAVGSVAAADAPVPTTRIEAGPAAQGSAALVAQLLGLPASVLRASSDAGPQVRVLLGPDFQLARR